MDENNTEQVTRRACPPAQQDNNNPPSVLSPYNNDVRSPSEKKSGSGSVESSSPDTTLPDGHVYFWAREGVHRMEDDPMDGGADEVPEVQKREELQTGVFVDSAMPPPTCLDENWFYSATTMHFKLEVVTPAKIANTIVKYFKDRTTEVNLEHEANNVEFRTDNLRKMQIDAIGVKAHKSAQTCSVQCDFWTTEPNPKWDTDWCVHFHCMAGDKVAYRNACNDLAKFIKDETGATVRFQKGVEGGDGSVAMAALEHDDDDATTSAMTDETENELMEMMLSTDIDELQEAAEHLEMLSKAGKTKDPRGKSRTMDFLNEATMLLRQFLDVLAYARTRDAVGLQPVEESMMKSTQSLLEAPDDSALVVVELAGRFVEVARDDRSAAAVSEQLLKFISTKQNGWRAGLKNFEKTCMTLAQTDRNRVLVQKIDEALENVHDSQVLEALENVKTVLRRSGASSSRILEDGGE